MSIIIKAKAEYDIFKNGDFRITSFAPLETNNMIKLDKNMRFTCKGEHNVITVGKKYELEIEESGRDKYGVAYKIISVPSIDKQDFSNLSRDESFEIIMDCTSSERIANNILEAYPNFVHIVLTEGKEAIDTDKIKGVGSEYLKAYTRILLDKYKYYHVQSKFKDFELDTKDCKSLCSIYKTEDEIQKAFDENPYYVSTEVLDRRFEYSDKMIVSLRDDLKDSRIRCEALMIHVLRMNEEQGSTKLNGNVLYKYIKEEYDVPQLLKYIVDIAKESDMIYYDEESKSLSVMATYNAEKIIANFVKEKLANSHVLDIDVEKYREVDGFRATDMQISALSNVCKYDFSLLVGYSGSGKTSTLKAMISMLEDNGLSYSLLAPTGKASKRASEATNRPSSTIHRMVYSGDIWTDVVILDETSMVDLRVFVMLINAIKNPNCKIVLCGDNAQLMPIGLACVFNDIINSKKAPTTMLTEIFRYTSSGSLFVATNVRQGINFFNDDMVKQNGNEFTVGDNYKFIQTDNIFEKVVEEYSRLVRKGHKITDIMCLSPFNVGEEGTYNLNNAIQAEFNPPKPNEELLYRTIKKLQIAFRLGDEIINKKNNYRAVNLEAWERASASNGLLNAEDIGLCSIFNGQCGTVKSVDNKKVVVQMDEELIVFDKMALNNLLLSYAISTHSSQGSESKIVINIVSPLHKRMLNRNLLYVADTRSKELQIDIGDMNTYIEALMIDGNKERNTYLEDMLKED